VKDGGAAFPFSEYGECGKCGTWVDARQTVRGISIRDYFAAAALQGLMAASKSTEHGRVYAVDAPDWANIAYQYADAMLLERQKPQGKTE
jgi:hypothetical protein